LNGIEQHSPYSKDDVATQLTHVKLMKKKDFVVAVDY
jgi:hypothetical protein